MPKEIESKKYVCRPGDTIYTVAGETLGDSDLWPQIMEVNSHKKNLTPSGQPKHIDVGETFAVPKMTDEEKEKALEANRAAWAKAELEAQQPEHLRNKAK